MDIFQSIILGIIQGITEFFPISSTAHLALIPWFFSWKDPGLSYNVALHFGSLFAILVYFRNTWKLVISQFIQGALKRNFNDLEYGRVGLFIILATIPAVISGLLFETYAAGILRHPLIIAGSLLIFGLLLLYSNKVSKEKRSINNMTIKDSLIIGAAQAFAIIPGASRSGVTITGALLRNFKTDEAAKFSFLMAAPLIVGATVYESRHMSVESIFQTPFLIGILVSAVFAFLAIKYLLRFVRFRGYKYFVYYRIVLAAVITLMHFLG
ncbi:MAG TPA: undecaprenyl-diphosphate phosphatase [Thermodesulfobacteriota bacterium]|nr:undecaprenyl-diphosphate phosphatase [Thermodesulfobacteriota bacterium]